MSDVMTRKTFVIAELGVNHNGDIGIAKEMVRSAAEARVDAIKLQTFDPSKLVTHSAQRAPYQVDKNSDETSQYEMLEQLRLTRDDHSEIKELCDLCDLEFMSTAFDQESMEYLVHELAVSRLKIGSGDLTNGPLILAAAQSELDILISTGMGNVFDIRTALDIVAYGYSSEGYPKCVEDYEGLSDNDEMRKTLQENVTLLQCTTEYPTSYSEVNIRTIPWMRKTFGLPIGFSDHSLGTIASIGAVTLGATVVEKHLTLDKSMPGPDQSASLEPSEFVDLVKSIEEVELCLGNEEKVPQPSELKNMSAARRSIVAIEDIQSGEKYSKNNIGVKRPGSGVSPMRFWSLLGTESDQFYESGELIR